MGGKRHRERAVDGHKLEMNHTPAPRDTQRYQDQI